MKLNWNYIKMIGLIAVVAFLFGFANKRHNKRDFTGVKVQFGQGENRFLTVSDVKKSLGLKVSDSASNLNYVKNNLRNFEAHLLENHLIKSAEVYIGINGELKTKIIQRSPIARIVAEPHYYMDENGGKMPLSNHFSARVPLVEIADDEQVKKLFPVLKKIHTDEFLSTLVTDLNFKEKNNIKLHLRDMPMDINFGKAEKVQLKFNNLKAFYKKMQKGESSNQYKEINLTFENQVVATKK